MREDFCEHIKSGEARVYQRLDIDGRAIYHCWKCAEQLNPILGKVQDLWERLNEIAGSEARPRNIFTTSTR